MPVAKRAILDCHAVAKEIDDKEAIALCHAVGQACAVVHTVGHALGFPIYDLTATICRCGSDDFASAVLARKNDYIDKLFYWREHSSDPVYTWAPFMLK